MVPILEIYKTQLERFLKRKYPIQSEKYGSIYLAELILLSQINMCPSYTSGKSKCDIKSIMECSWLVDL